MLGRPSGPICCCEIARQGRQRSAVRRDVMEQHHEGVVGFAQRKQPRANWDACGQMEAMACCMADQFAQFFFGCFEDFEDGRRRFGSQNGLLRNPVDFGENGAKDFVSHHQIAERSLECFSVQRSAKTKCEWNVIDGVGSFELVQEAIRKRNQERRVPRDLSL